MKKVLLVVFLLSSLNAITFEEAKKGCDNNIGAACATVGAAYFNGMFGLEPDIAKATQYWEKGCDLENGSACMTYASTIMDQDKQLTITQKACDLGNENGCKFVKEIKLYRFNKEKCINGNAQACYETAQNNLLKLDFNIAKEFFQLACKAGDKKSCADYTKLDENGDKTELNAIIDLKTKCDGGDKGSCLSVGTYYMGLINTTKNNIDVFKLLMVSSIWFKQGCKLGDDASCMLDKRISAALSMKEK